MPEMAEGKWWYLFEPSSVERAYICDVAQSAGMDVYDEIQNPEESPC